MQPHINIYMVINNYEVIFYLLDKLNLTPHK